MPVPGHLWWIYDDYGIVWNDEAFPTYVQAYYFRKKMRREFPCRMFYFRMDQRDSSRPLPFYFHVFKGDLDEDQEPGCNGREFSQRDSETENFPWSKNRQTENRNNFERVNPTAYSESDF